MVANCMIRICNLMQSGCEDFFRNKITRPLESHFNGQSIHACGGWVTTGALIWGKC